MLSLHWDDCFARGDVDQLGGMEFDRESSEMLSGFVEGEDE